MDPEPQQADPPRRRWLQFSLRSLLVLTLVASLVMSWLAVRWERDRRVRRAVARLEELGASISWVVPVGSDSDDVARAEAFLVLIAGNGPGPRSRETDDLLRLLGDLPNVHSLLFENLSLHDDDLPKIGSLRTPQCLWLEGPITDAGLDHLTGLKYLVELRLIGVPATDARIGRLFEQLPALEEVLWQRAGLEIPEFANARFNHSGMDFPGYPLEDVLGFCEDYFAIKVALDPEIDHLSDVPVNVTLRGDCAYDVVRGLVNPLRLEVVVRQSDLLVTTAAKAAEMPRVRWSCQWRREGGRVVFEERIRIMAPEDSTRSR